MNYDLQIASFTFSTSEIRLLKQIWRNDYADCASLEEATRRIALNGIKRSIGLRKAFNVLKKMRDAGHTVDEIVQSLKDRELDYEAVINHAKANAKADAEAKDKTK